jgi:hypothetical protein
VPARRSAARPAGTGGGARPRAATLAAGTIVLAAALLAGCGAATPPASAPAPRRLRVLFIGNSLTFVNDLPGQLRRLVAAEGVVLQTAQVTPGGASLDDHWKGAAARAAIARGGWTHVVIQPQTLEPFTMPRRFRAAAARLAAASRAVGATPLLLEPWAMEPFHPVYAERWARGGPAALSGALRRAFAAVGPASGAPVVPVGPAFDAARRQRPGLRLTGADGGHPSPAGTYLAACVLAVTLTGRALPAAGAPPRLAPADAAFLRERAVAATLPELR